MLLGLSMLKQNKYKNKNRTAIKMYFNYKVSNRKETVVIMYKVQLCAILVQNMLQI